MTFLCCLTQAAARPEKARYISLSPAATEILFALGLKDQVIANTIYCNYPEEAKGITKIGTFSDPNIEQIITLRPDIIFTTGLEQAPIVSKLKKLGFKVIVSDPKNILELFSSIIQFGEITGKETEAEKLTKNLKERVEAVRSKAQNISEEKRKRVFIEIWYDPLMTAGPGSIIDELISLAGGKNIANDTPKPYSRFSSEAIIERNPEVIILCYMTKDNTKDLVSRRLGWKNISAVKNKRIISDIDPDLILRPSPRIVDGLEEIYKRLYDE